MSVFEGAFLGFTYGDIHSSDLGIVRVSDGSRFNENLLPTQQNRTINIPGRDETYYFGGDSTQKQFDVSFAFDSMTQNQLDNLRSLFGGKEIRDLKFDERGDITWRAKVSSSSIKYVPFNGEQEEDLFWINNTTSSSTTKKFAFLSSKLGIKKQEKYCVLEVIGNISSTNNIITNGTIKYYTASQITAWGEKAEYKAINPNSTIYKGEGTVQFTCYQPFGLLTETLKLIETREEPEEGETKGDLLYASRVLENIAIPLDWRLVVNFYNQMESNGTTIKEKRGIMSIYLKVGNVVFFEGSINIRISGTVRDEGVFIDSQTGLVEGWYTDANNNKIKSGTIYSLTGNISKIPSGTSTFYVGQNNTSISYTSVRLNIEQKYY